jgi:hypothetical protein
MSENISELSAKTDHHSKNPRCTEPFPIPYSADF